MFLNNFEIFITKAINTKYICKTIESLYETISESLHNQISFQIISEKDCHENTLNEVLNRSTKDVLVVADDILFKNGWLEALEKNLESGDIIGFSMLKPETTTLLDFGYDFVLIDGELSYQSELKGEKIENVNIDSFRECDSVCGCCMYIKKEVIDSGVKFQKDGCQRWSELIFSHQAREIGFKTIVLSNNLYHYGISTKQSNNPMQSSISWLIEKQLWEKVVLKYLTTALPKNQIVRKIGQELQTIINNKKSISLYGCGTVAQLIINYNPDKKYVVYSGLEEEIGKDFFGYTIKNIDEKPPNEDIIITSIGYEKVIMSQFFLKNNKENIYQLCKYVKDTRIIFNIDRKFREIKT